ncbi:MAG: sensor histidine kinase [Candidatus Rokubacteria bacterium]|nr:sensor histidine kinase [Candidatus Rokubacteria bacterium]
MGWHPLVEKLGKYKELALATVFVFMAGQELIESLVLESSRVVAARFPLGVLLHLGQVLVILAGTYVFIKAWQEKTELMNLEVRRSGELAMVIGTLQEKEQALACMMERLIVVQEEERRLVAYDIHDCLAQLIVSAKQHLDTFEGLWRGQSPEAPGELERGLDRLDRAIVETRRLLAALRPGTLDSLGLIPALRALLDETSHDTGWDAQLLDNLCDVRLPPTVETTLYRIIQEALANAKKHANASCVTVDLRKEGDHVVVEVNDSGVGFHVTTDRSQVTGLGLIGMQERARLLGGSCRIESSTGLGTRILATIPVRNGRSSANHP